MFGVIAEYDGDVRWKQQALGARDAFGKVAANCKVGTDASYNESKLRKADLEDLVGGASPDLKPNPDDFTWGKLMDRVSNHAAIGDCFRGEVEASDIGCWSFRGQCGIGDA